MVILKFTLNLKNFLTNNIIKWDLKKSYDPFQYGGQIYIFTSFNNYKLYFFTFLIAFFV